MSPSDDKPTPDEACALAELREAGGAKRLIFCRFTTPTMLCLVAAGWVKVDDVPVVEAVVRLTDAGCAASEIPSAASKSASKSAF